MNEKTERSKTILNIISDSSIMFSRKKWNRKSDEDGLVNDWNNQDDENEDREDTSSSNHLPKITELGY